VYSQPSFAQGIRQSLFAREVFSMKTAHARHSMSHGQFATHRTRIGVAAILALAALACTSAAIESNGGAGGGGGKGGMGGSTSGAGGSGPTFKLDGSTPSTGGTTGGSGVCNSTSTAGCVAQYPRLAATESTIRVVSNSATTGTYCRATAATATARSSPTGLVHRPANARGISFAATAKLGRARCATMAILLTVMVVIPPARFRIPPTPASPDSRVSEFPSAATSASSR